MRYSLSVIKGEVYGYEGLLHETRNTNKLTPKGNRNRTKNSNNLKKKKKKLRVRRK